MLVYYLVLSHHSKRRHKVRSGLVRIPRSTHATLPQWMSRHPWRARAWRRVHLLSAALHHNIKSVLGVSIHFFPPPPPLCTTESLPSSFHPSFSRSSSVCLHDSRSVRPSVRGFRIFISGIGKRPRLCPLPSVLHRGPPVTSFPLNQYLSSHIIWEGFLHHLKEGSTLTAPPREYNNLECEFGKMLKRGTLLYQGSKGPKR